jgi:hypothetical protein
VDELRAKLKAAHASFREAQQAIDQKDSGQLEAELQKFRESYGAIQEAAKRSAR